MKKNNIRRAAPVFIFIAGLLVLPGCEGFLTRDADNQTTEDAWWYNKTMLQTVLNQCYQPMPSGTLNTSSYDVGQSSSTASYNNMRIEMEGLSDNGVTIANYISNRVITYGTVQSSHGGITNIWQMKYMAIRRCCRYLENYKRAFVEPDATPWEGIQTLDRWAAEVRALRAYYHMELFMYFGAIPIVDHVTTVEEQNLARATEQMCIDWIASEFEEASRNLPVHPQETEERWRWTKGACYAHLSWLYLYAGDHTKALAWAQKVIDMGIYDIYVSAGDKANSYRNQFLHEAYTNNTKESILTKNQGCRGHIARLLPPSHLSGTSGVCPTSAFIDCYQMKDGTPFEELSAAEQGHYHLYPTPTDRDPRLGMTVYFPGETFLGKTFDCWKTGTTDYIGARNSTITGYWVKKWLNATDLSSSSNYASSLPFQLMRYAEILLTYVECQIELGNINDPLIFTYLNKIRDRAGMPEVDRSKYNTQDKLRKLLRYERRVELAFEGYRYYDIKRWKIADQVMNGPVYGAKYPNADELYYVENRRFNPDRDYYWPIPLTEMNANENMVQNPGY